MPATSQHRVPPAGGAEAPPARRGGRGSVPPPPSPFEPDARWRDWRRTRRERLPGWAFDADWLTSHALEALPRVLKALGCGKPVAYLPRPEWWFAPDLPAEAVARHGLNPLPDLEPVIELPLEPGSDTRLFVDMNLGGWDCPNLCRRGDDLVSLAAWRWGLTPAKAAWELARTLGLGRPTP
jgi:hypothetical protein